MPQILYPPRAVVLSASGGLQAGAKCYTYLTNTTTPQATYADYALTIPNANPVLADANGVFPIMFGINTTRYRLKFTTSSGALLYQEDDIGPDTAASLGAATLAAANTFTGSPQKISALEPRLILDESDAAADKRLWDFDVNGAVLKIRTRTDADGTGKDVLTVTRGATTAIASIDIGNATDLPTITFNGVAPAAATSGSFTGTLTGCTTSPTATFNWNKIGAMVIIDCIGGLAAVSNATTMTVTGLPAALEPARTQMIYTKLEDNAAGVLGAVYMTSGSTVMSFGLGASGNQAGFTNVNAKGILTGFSITYALT